MRQPPAPLHRNSSLFGFALAACGLDAAGASEALGISENSISQWITGRREPPPHIYDLLAAQLEATERLTAQNLHAIRAAIPPGEQSLYYEQALALFDRLPRDTQWRLAFARALLKQAREAQYGGDAGD